MLMVVAAQDVAEKRAASSKNDFMSLNLFIITGQSNIKKVLVITEFFESIANIALKIIPTQAELLTFHAAGFSNTDRLQMAAVVSQASAVAGY
jgi:hypothetical protein